MAERVVRYKAIADFLSLARDTRKARDELKELRREEEKLNESSARTSAKADAADVKRQQTRKGLIASMTQYAEASAKASTADEAAVRATRTRNQEQSKFAQSLKSAAQSVKDYGNNVQNMIVLEQKAGGAKRELARAQEAQVKSSTAAAKAAETLQRAEERLANTQQRAAQESQAAASARSKAANTAERAALALVAAEERLSKVKTDRPEQSRKAELSLADARITSERAVARLEQAEKRLTATRSNRDNNSIRRAERDVAAAMQASTQAAGQLASVSKRVEDIISTLSGAGSGLGGVLGTLQKGLGGFASSLASSLPMLAAVAAAIPTIISLLATLAGGLVAVGGGAVALVSALGPLVGVLGALPGAIAGAAFAVGTLAAAFMGVGEAVKESLAVQKNAGKVAKDSAKAQKQAARQVADSLRALRNAKEQQARGEISANRAVRDATQSLTDAREAAVEGQAQAVRSLMLSERSLRDAQDNSRRAQENLTRTREEALQNIIDLKEAVEDAARSEQRASLSVAEARAQLQAVLDDPNATDLQKRDARLAVAEAMDALDDVKKQSEKTRKDYQKAQKQGVDKADAVVEAQKQQRDALEQLADAQYAVVQATKAQTKQQVESARTIKRAQEQLSEAITSRSLQQRDAAEGVADAQRNLTDAYDNQKEAALTTFNATEKLRQAMEELGPEGQAFVQLLLRLKPIFDGIRKSAQAGLFPGLGAALQTFAELAPIITPAVKTMGEAIGDAAKKVADVTKSPIFRGQLARILESSSKIMGDVGKIVANLVQVFTNVADAARPFTEWLSETTVGWTEQWKAMTSGKKGQQRLTDFFDEAKDTIKIVAGLLFDFAKALLGIGKASKGVGKDFLKQLANSAKQFSEFVNSKDGQARIKKWFEDIKPTVEAIAHAASDLVDFFIGLADDPGVQKFFQTFADDFVPNLVRLVKAIGTQPAQGFLDVIDLFVNWGANTAEEFRKFVENVAYFVSLLPGMGSADDASVSLGKFLDVLTVPSGLILLNSGLDALKKLLQWFNGGDDASASGSGGTWGSNGPLGSFGETIDWVQGKLSGFLTWVLKNWPGLLLTLISPFAGAILQITGGWDKFNIDMKAKFQDLITWLKRNWPSLLGIFTSPLTLAIPTLKSLGGKIFNLFEDLWASIQSGGDNFVEGLGRTIDKLRGVFADPVKFVINSVLNGGLIDGFNSLISKITGNDKLNIPHISAPGFASGGVYPGYTPGRDVGYIGISGGEAIMRPEWTRAVGASEVDRMNAAARRGGKKGVQRYLGGFKAGGVAPGSEGGGGDFAPTTFRGKRMNYRTIKMLLAAEKLYGGQFSITQGSYSTSVAASGSTHAGGGALDLGWTGANAQVKDLRRVGFAAWHRNPLQGPWNDHVHVVAIGDPTASESAKRQVASYLAGGNGLGGTDDGPRVAIDTDLASKLGITDADVAAAAKGGGGGFLDKLAGWVRSAVGNPLGFLKDKISGPVGELFSKFGSGVLTQMLSKVPEMAFSSMVDTIKNTVGNFISDIVPGGGGGSSEIKSMVQKRAASYGWDKGGSWDSLQWIINKESSWNPNAQNPNSSAYGLFQFLDSTWGAYGGSKTSDPGAQTDLGLKYIKQRYGNPEAARAFHQNYGWYAEGGVVPSAPVQAFARGGPVAGFGNRDSVPAMLTPGEFVLRKDVVKKIGKRKLEQLNNKRSDRRAPSDAGVQPFHSGGPVMGFKLGGKGNSIRALRYLMALPTGPSAQYGIWDTPLDRVLRKPNAYKAMVGGQMTPYVRGKQIPFTNYLGAHTGFSYPKVRDALHLNDAQMLKLWDTVKPSYTKKHDSKNWGFFDKGARQTRSRMNGYVGDLNRGIGLGANGNEWGTEGRAAMKHILEHSYGQAHDPLEFRPWSDFSPVETAARNAIAANKKAGEFNGFLEILSNWGLSDLVKDLLDKGVDDGYNIAQSATKNKAVATILNNEIKNAKLLTAEDQGNVLKMIAFMAASQANFGLRDLARALGLSDLNTVLLFEKANQLKRLSGVPKSKLGKLTSDIASFRAGTFYAATGGQVPGSGSGDTVPAMLTPGEFVVRKAAVQALGLDTMHWLNNPQKFAGGGMVQPFALAGVPRVDMPRVGAAIRSGSAGAFTNGSGVTLNYDIDINNPVAETSTKSLTKALQRSSVISGNAATSD